MSSFLSAVSCSTACILLRCADAGLGVQSSTFESCGTDVEDALVLELGRLVDIPCTTMGNEVFRIALYVLPFLMRCGFLTTGPLTRVSVIFAEFSKR